MSSRNTSRLEAGLIARKGEAFPAQTETAASVVVADAQSQDDRTGNPFMGPPRRAARGLHGTIAVTVRLDPERYERLKMFGARGRYTNQDILVEALDRFLSAAPE